MPALCGNMRGDGEAGHVAIGVANGGIPMAHRGDRARPMAETSVQLRRTLGEPVGDSDLLGTPEGSLALLRIAR